MHAPKMVNLLENYSAVLFQVGLQNVEDNAISKPKKRNPKPTLIFIFFFLEHSTTVTQCICFYCCGPSMNMLFFSMLGLCLG